MFFQPERPFQWLKGWRNLNFFAKVKKSSNLFVLLDGKKVGKQGDFPTFLSIIRHYR